MRENTGKWGKLRKRSYLAHPGVRGWLQPWWWRQQINIWHKQGLDFVPFCEKHTKIWVTTVVLHDSMTGIDAQILRQLLQNYYKNSDDQDFCSYLWHWNTIPQTQTFRHIQCNIFNFFGIYIYCEFALSQKKKSDNNYSEYWIVFPLSLLGKQVAYWFFPGAMHQ